MTHRVYVESSCLTAARHSGVAHSLLYTLRAWQNLPANRRYEVILLVPFDKRKQLQELGLKFRIVALPLPDIGLRILRKFNLLPPFDVLIGTGIYIFPNYWSWPLAMSKAFTYIYDVSFLAHPEFVEPHNRQFLRKNIYKWLSRSELVLTVSEYSKGEIARYCGVSTDKIEVIHCGVEQFFFTRNSHAQIEAMKKRYGIVGEYLLFIGNIEPRKNISGLLQAYGLLPSTLKAKYMLVLIGADGWNNQDILNEILVSRKKGEKILKIDVPVLDSELPALYGGASILVHPALYEGFGITPLEAMAAGTPVIVANNSSLPEVVGDAGLYVNARRKKDISDKIKLLLSDRTLQYKLSKAGKARARLFNWDKAALKLDVLVGEQIK